MGGLVGRVVRALRRAEVRGYLYRVLVALGLLLGAYGVLDDAEVAQWAAFGAVLLGTGTAALNTPTVERRRRRR